MNSLCAMMHKLKTFASTDRKVQECQQRYLFSGKVINFVDLAVRETVESGPEVDQFSQIVLARRLVDCHNHRRVVSRRSRQTKHVQRMERMSAILVMLHQYLVMVEFSFQSDGMSTDSCDHWSPYHIGVEPCAGNLTVCLANAAPVMAHRRTDNIEPR